MATRCEVKACPYYAVEGEKLCLQHKPKPIPRNTSAEADGYSFVPITEVPRSSRYNEVAAKLLAAVKAAQPGHALKVSMTKFKNPQLMTAKKYALADGFRIGVRIVGQAGYLWKLSETELKAIEIKVLRLKATRAKRGSKRKAL